MHSAPNSDNSRITGNHTRRRFLPFAFSAGETLKTLGFIASQPRPTNCLESGQECVPTFYLRAKEKVGHLVRQTEERRRYSSPVQI